jgi:hypothetical protein
MKKGYYTATTARGVEFHGEILENPEIEVLNPIEFLDELNHLDDDEEIFTSFDNESFHILEEIETQYGIRS